MDGTLNSITIFWIGNLGQAKGDPTYILGWKNYIQIYLMKGQTWVYQKLAIELLKDSAFPEITYFGQTKNK